MIHVKNSSQVKALVLQPLPQLCWQDATGYSEFPSLGISRLSEELKKFDVDVTARYPRTARDLAEIAAMDVDFLVIGDFRYYAYFANPLPIVRVAVRALAEEGAAGRILVAGRHAAQFPDLSDVDREIGLCCSLAKLVEVLTGGRSSVSSNQAANGDALPGPGLPDMEILNDGGDLPGSFSRPGARMAQLLLTKGCPFSCSFCEKADTEVSTMTREDLDRALGQFQAGGFERVVFWDEVFAWPYQRNREHLAVLRSHSTTFNCNSRLDTVRQPFVKALSDAGCREVLFGLEVSPGETDEGNFLNLDRGKRGDLAFVRDRVSLLRDHGISPVGSVIVGLPDDTVDTVRRRLDAVDSLGLSHCYVRPLVPFPESGLYSALLEDGVVPEFQAWDEMAYKGFPHGYPTVSSIDRGRLAELCGR